MKGNNDSQQACATWKGASTILLKKQLWAVGVDSGKGEGVNLLIIFLIK
jgi:hypothetical protein